MSCDGIANVYYCGGQEGELRERTKSFGASGSNSLADMVVNGEVNSCIESWGIG